MLRGPRGRFLLHSGPSTQAYFFLFAMLLQIQFMPSFQEKLQVELSEPHLQQRNK